MNDQRRRRQRRLSEAERSLWGEITQDVRPLRPRSGERRDTAEADADPPTAPAEKKPLQTIQPRRPAHESSRPPPLAPLGRRMRQRIARGSHAIEARLDLHGMTQGEAHDELLGFLRTAQERGVTLVLVITGKGGAAAEGEHGRGVLKRQVPHWLRLPAFRGLIVGFEPAHVTHGGEGALYVRLRRKRHAG